MNKRKTSQGGGGQGGVQGAQGTVAPTAQRDWLEDWPAQGLSAAQTLQWLQSWTAQGLLRHLDSALAAQLLRLDAQTPPALLVAAALLAQMEGRGHTCLPLADVCEAPVTLLGWPAAALDGPQGLRALWWHLPHSVSAWLTVCAAAVVRGPDVPDRGQPLVLAGTAEAPLLYLRRYAGYEQRVGQGLLQRATEALALPSAVVRPWLDRFFAPHAPASAEMDWQKVACAVALRARLSVITGGPGTGKTYTAARLLAVLLALHEASSPSPSSPLPDSLLQGGFLRVALAAPTGKAAARLKQSIDQALEALQAQVPAGSPLDLAALIARMGPARTLHALLGARPDSRQFRHHAGHPLDVDVLIVDEASMVHLEMMDAVLQALPPHARLVLLGDKDQLASVEAGAVLGALCRQAAAGHYSAETAQFVQAATGQTLPARYLAENSLAHGAAPVLAQQTVMLRQSRRFQGAIGQLALAVNAADAQAARAVAPVQVAWPPLAEHAEHSEHGEHGEHSGHSGRAGQAVLALQPHSPQAVCALARGLGGRPSYADYLHRMHEGMAGAGQGADANADADADAHSAWVRRVLLAFDRFRILCAVRQGDWGTEGLNASVQKTLREHQLIQPEGEWFAGRPVMVTRNDATLGVFNGDVGVVLPNREGALKVWFLDAQALRAVSVMRLAHVETAFAMTVHKSQGSEFEHVALVLPPGGANVLSRELVYTGITRARAQLTLLEAEAGLLEAAIARPSVRASGLAQWF